MPTLPVSKQALAFRWLAFVLAACAALSFAPLWAPLVLAAWVAMLGRPLLLKVAKVLGGRNRAAAGFILLLVVLLFLPLGIALVSLTSGAIDLARTAIKSGTTREALVGVVSGGEATNLGDLLKEPGKLVALAREHGTGAAQLLGSVAGAATAAMIGLFVFLYAVYEFLVDGPRYSKWIEEHAPIAVEHTRRLAHAFNETGRGLFVGLGLTGLAQGLVATATYFALGVPRAFVLGLLTCAASLIPSVGTALVWVPVAIGLALAGKVGSAAILGGVGVLVIGSVDNLLRPLFTRFGKLELPTFVLLTSIFGALAVFGTWGFILGPLLARLAKEALVIVRTELAAD